MDTCNTTDQKHYYRAEISNSTSDGRSVCKDMACANRAIVNSIPNVKTVEVEAELVAALPFF